MEFNSSIPTGHSTQSVHPKSVENVTKEERTSSTGRRHIKLVRQKLPNIITKAKSFGHFFSKLKLHERSVKPHVQAPRLHQPSLHSKATHFQAINPPQHKEAKAQLVVEASLASYPYHHSTNKVTEEAAQFSDALDKNALSLWQPQTELVSQLASELNLEVNKEKGLLFDKKTGLVAAILVQPETGKIRLVFGGTTSGEKSGGLAARSLTKNAGITRRQWKSNIQNALGRGTPKNFSQARMLTQNLTQKLQDSPQYDANKLILLGHSKGGAEATFAALSQPVPPQVFAFSSAELHKNTLKLLPKENLAQAKELIHVVNISKDIVPNVGKITPLSLTPVGSVMTLPAKHLYSGERHDSFLQHVTAYAKKS